MDDNLEFILRRKGSDISIDFLEPIVIPLETHNAKLGRKKQFCNVQQHTKYRREEE